MDCHFCGKKGHRKANCRKFLAQKEGGGGRQVSALESGLSTRSTATASEAGASAASASKVIYSVNNYANDEHL